MHNARLADRCFWRMSAAPEQGPAPLPRLETSLSPEQVFDRLSTLARAGKFAGYRRTPQGFAADAYAVPFEKDLLATVTPGERTRLTFALRTRRRIPVAFWVIAALTVWPGVWLTDSMLRLYISAYRIETWWWYIPLSVLPLPWAWRVAVRKSALAARAAAEVSIAQIERELAASRV